jgi:hypothetical protein
MVQSHVVSTHAIAITSALFGHGVEFYLPDDSRSRYLETCAIFVTNPKGVMPADYSDLKILS